MAMLFADMVYEGDWTWERVPEFLKPEVARLLTDFYDRPDLVGD